MIIALRFTNLMRAKFRVIQLLDGILHVILTNEFHNTCSVFEGISIAHVSSLSHVILQVLPATAAGESCDQFYD